MFFVHLESLVQSYEFGVLFFEVGFQSLDTVFGGTMPFLSLTK